MTSPTKTLGVLRGVSARLSSKNAAEAPNNSRVGSRQWYLSQPNGSPPWGKWMIRCSDSVSRQGTDTDGIRMTEPRYKDTVIWPPPRCQGQKYELRCPAHHQRKPVAGVAQIAILEVARAANCPGHILCTDFGRKYVCQHCTECLFLPLSPVVGVLIPAQKVGQSPLTQK